MSVATPFIFWITSIKKSNFFQLSQVDFFHVQHVTTTVDLKTLSSGFGTVEWQQEQCSLTHTHMLKMKRLGSPEPQPCSLESCSPRLGQGKQRHTHLEVWHIELSRMVSVYETVETHSLGKLISTPILFMPLVSQSYWAPIPRSFKTATLYCIELYKLVKMLTPADVIIDLQLTVVQIRQIDESVGSCKARIPRTTQ